MFDIQLFGRIEVRTRGILLAGNDFGGERPRHLLASLALRGERSLVDLADTLGVAPATVKDDLRVLRDRLEPGVRGRDSVVSGYLGLFCLVPERVRVDVATFDELITAAAGRSPERAARPLSAAAFLASRPLLEEECAPWAAEARAEYRAKLLMAHPGLESTALPPDFPDNRRVLPTSLQPVPLAPEISLHLADRPVGLFDVTGGEFRSDEPPPFWAFAWAGGQALARYLLDHPDQVAGRRVRDVATGSGVAAIAAARCGAAEVEASDINPAAVAAAHRNAAANGVTLAERVTDPEVVLAGDVFYSPAVAPPMTSLLRAASRRGASVLVGDPGRGYFPERLFELVTEYVVPVPAALEETESLRTGVWKMRSPRNKL